MLKTHRIAVRRLVRDFMSASPHTIGAEQPLARAHEVMRAHAIRHLPVLHGGTLVGIVSLRDLHFLEAIDEFDPEKVTVEEAMTAEPYTVSADEHIEDVAIKMAEHKYGTAIVVDGRKVVGIFTTIDALRALAQSGLVRTSAKARRERAAARGS